MNYKDWLANWLDNYVQPSVKQRTYTRYKEIAERHLIPALGELELRDMTPYVLQCYVSALLKNGNLKTGEGLAANSVNAIITVVQNALKTAYSLGMIPEYTGDKIKRPRMQERCVLCFSVQEQKTIERYVLQDKSTRYFGVLLCLYTGLRIGELLALSWPDMNTKKCEIYINKSCHYGITGSGTYGRIIDLPKTPSSVRTIPLPRQLMPLLREVKKKSRSLYIVANGENPVSIRSYQRSFALLLKKLNIPHRGFHSLRHTFATRALECGMDVKTLSEILGHKNPMVTLNRYAHSLMEHKKEMMNKLGKLL